MCGIVGILGKHEVSPLILDALQRLEYRGYDSAGIATLDEGQIDRRRALGKLINLSDLLVHEPLKGRAGIGHTRWATHGGPSVANAHPHHKGRVAVVHNGIIENFRALREELSADGSEFTSQTDTETIVHLASKFLDQGMSPDVAARETLKKLEGAFALAFLFEGEENLMIAARRGSPLVIGHGQGEMYVGSDAIALAPLTDLLTYLEEGDWAVITREGAEVHDASGNIVSRPMTRISQQNTRIDKSGHRHFMAKEMAEQPAILKAALGFYGVPNSGISGLPEGVDFAQADRVILVACGTAHYACHVAKYWFEQIAHVPVEIDIASEFRYRAPVLTAKTIAIFVSQSGETADTLAALRHVKGKIAQTIAVVNIPTSSIAREADLALPLHAGPEISVASTKTFTAQLLVLALLSLKAGVDRGRLDAKACDQHLEALQTVPGYVAQALDREDNYRSIAEILAKHDDVLFLGRGLMYPLSLEAALKFKEISYIHAEAYAAGELKHGPIALIDKNLPVVVMAPRDDLFGKTISNMQEVMARSGKIVLISDKAGLNATGGAEYTITLPAVPSFISPFVYSVPAQMLAYHTALARGTDVDQPRNLAKSVTVE
ncbi:glutamine--fructose-6-phosphate transaminase (isomerizing) [Roseinatronobacter alkalisoli]|uniref:Glutamine--fructose-6-phosphate aminotransferase [isomerizing] n=1 Tax=Roseinatronobacter alkalisoli TaxID=3028235 RepID=A0ABT5TAA0_9RHOB|nr:glutamine--fructose-6-phosphate transaminase (isomerizing) [Roseinatronobacter sp. HJB301]MDD7971994.1 glutamine--fructose-6-phosphate transaminase (isomerizing) [Roseinatronobacter sp. HJB301]